MQSTGPPGPAAANPSLSLVSIAVARWMHRGHVLLSQTLPWGEADGAREGPRPLLTQLWDEGTPVWLC